MKLDVKSLVNSPVGETQSFAIELFKEQIDEEVLAEWIRGNLKLTKLEDDILARFTGSVKLTSTCDRCAEDLPLDLPLKFSEEYSLDRSHPGDERQAVSRQFEIDIAEPIRQEILAAIPVKKLCRPDCAGLCPDCGANLNAQECKCKAKNDKA